MCDYNYVLGVLFPKVYETLVFGSDPVRALYLLMSVSLSVSVSSRIVQF